MSPRVQHVFACQGCGAVSPKWLGRCPECSEWNTYVEELTGEARGVASETRAAPIAEAPAEPGERTSTTLPGLDRVLGGGLVPGSLVLLGGEPGIGKSTLLLQAGRGVARSREVLYATGEESAGQVRLRGERLGIREERLFVAAETDVSRIVALAEKRTPALLVVDSIQAVRDGALTSAAGSVSQVRESALVLQRFAKLSGVPVILIGHVTKDGSLAGPKSLEHLVDAVVSIEGERGGMRRILRATKNRFGPVDELALYEMTGEGLSEIANASAALLASGARDSPAAPSRRRARVLVACWSRCRPWSGRPPPARRGASRSGSTVPGWPFCSPSSKARASRSRRGKSSCRAREVSRSGSPPRTLRSWRPWCRPRAGRRCRSRRSSSARSGFSGKSGASRRPRPGSRRPPPSASRRPSSRRATRPMRPPSGISP